MRVDRCPECGSTDILQDEVDIGVGTQYGPARCHECGWNQQVEMEKQFPELGELDRAMFSERIENAWQALCRRLGVKSPPALIVRTQQEPREVMRGSGHPIIYWVDPEGAPSKSETSKEQ